MPSAPVSRRREPCGEKSHPMKLSSYAVWEGFSVGALAWVAFLFTACNQCEPGDCPPCVGETCDVECVEPNYEDIGYSCVLPCSDGADCSLTCDGVECNVDCAASTCECSGCDAHCTDGSNCTLGGHSRVACDASTCHSNCFAPSHAGRAQCDQVCTNGSTCTIACGDPLGFGAPGACRVSCDDTSSCHVACRGKCSICCNGSPDCVLDCPAGGVTCDDGTLVCGVACGLDIVEGEKCPAYDDEWIQSVD
jgi:hypothetical protein